MSWFTRVTKANYERGFDGAFAAKGNGAPPPHLRDKNASTTGQGANASQSTDETAPVDDVPTDPDVAEQDTTGQ